MRQAVAEVLRHLLPPRRLRSFPRVVKRKMSNFALKRDPHRRAGVANSRKRAGWDHGHLLRVLTSEVG